jgi:uncharacterized membrane protein YeaQ/YmgE (transglycosylase-associated protein family)
MPGGPSGVGTLAHATEPAGAEARPQKDNALTLLAVRHLSTWIWLAVEGISIGVLASYLSRTTAWTDLTIDSVAGASGSLFLAWFISPLNASASSMGWASLIIAALGSVFFVCVRKLLWS